MRNRIKKVFIAMVDPNPRHKGVAIDALRKQGIKVRLGLLDKEARLINQSFIKNMTKRLPYVTLKIGESLDGKIATRTGDSKWITCSQSRDLARKLRNEVDAIMVGINTVLKDNPTLNPQGYIKTKKYYKVVLDTNLRITKDAALFKDIKRFPVIIVTSKESFKKANNKKKSLLNKSAIILVVDKEGKVLDLKDVMKKLLYFDITHIFLEGGGDVSGSFVDGDLVDRILFFISPKIIGGSEAISSVAGRGVNALSETKNLQDIKVKKVGTDILVEGLINKY